MLCSNHVNVTFGKGLTPRQYRLDMTHVRANAVSIMRALSTVGTSAPPSTQHSRVTLVEPPNIAISSASMTNLRPALKRHESSYGSSGKVSFADNADDGDDDLDEKYAEDRYHTHEHHDGAYASRPPVPPRSPGRPAPYAFAQPNAHMESAPHAHAYAPHDSSAGGIRLVGQRSVDAADVRGLGLTLGFPEHAARQLREGHMANLA